MNAIWGAGLLSLSKLIVVVDADCDVHDYAEVAWRAFGNVDYAHDALHTVGPVDHLDHASYEQFFGGKLGIDATRKLPTEGYRRAGGWPTECVLDDGDGRAGRAALARVRHPALTLGTFAPIADRAGCGDRSRLADWAGDDRGPVGERARVRKFLSLVMIEHSVFALPFAYIAALTAMWRRPARCTGCSSLLITVAMVSARTVAMTANRILDRDFDALNPRTAQRELVTGELSRAQRLGRARWSRSSSSWPRPPRCRGCAWRSRRSRCSCSSSTPTASGSPTSRRCCSRWRSSSRRSARGSRSPAHVPPAAVALGIAVGTWIGGFDLIYSCQDAEIDRRDRLALVPGPLRHPGRAARVVGRARGDVAAFAWFGAAAGLGWLWWTGVALTAAVLVYEHVIVRADDLSRVNRAFFTANGVIGIGLFGFALADLVVHGHLGA